MDASMIATVFGVSTVRRISSVIHDMSPSLSYTETSPHSTLQNTLDKLDFASEWITLFSTARNRSCSSFVIRNTAF